MPKKKKEPEFDIATYEKLLKKQATLKAKVDALTRPLNVQLEKVQNRIKGMEKLQFAAMKPGDKITFGRVEFQNNIRRALSPEAGFDENLSMEFPLNIAGAFFAEEEKIIVMTFAEVDKSLKEFLEAGTITEGDKKQILEILGYKEHRQPKVKLLKKRSYYLDENGVSENDFSGSVEY